MPEEPEGGRRIDPPACARCGGPIRPGVVWFGEALPADALRHAMAMAEQADVFFAIGTSALVYPAAGLPEIAAAHGKTVVQVNPGMTSLDCLARYSLRGAAGDILPRLVAQLAAP